MAFEIYIPSSLTFQDYLGITQCARTLADGYDRKDKSRVRASLAPNVIVDYSKVVPEMGCRTFAADEFVEEWLGPTHLGVKALATQHLLGAPYFKSATKDEIVVEWQQLASHGRRVEGEDFAHPMCKIGESSDGRSWMQQIFVKVDGQWRISEIRPEVVYHTGDFLKVGRKDGEGA
ncbi:Putative Catalytic activity: scytalone dehydratases catalize the reaction of Scytalone <=_ 1 [Penicillium brasilianum]|uniref:Putative Catalytic activity: scytalone dehydratases catalize the reaction of Scytalone <=> 1 n=1 Tax=Penicillium brasilianum TaxID=104259 RepID=A0A0F7TRL7_PENBI|nr:Putative Catalytic activity: scytalone dehydratases catalize the reaction of Scytalone <=> 1 [Penicillium brasilianum]